MSERKTRKASPKELLSLFLTTFKIGAVTFGGGYVIIPMLQREFIEKHNYIEEKDILDIVAVSQALPGVLSINACIMVGYRAGGVIGAICTTLGVVLPSIITLSIVTGFYLEFAANPYIAFALLIYAGLDGLSRRLALPPCADVNLFEASPETLSRYRRLPATLEDAQAAAAESAFVREHLPAPLLEAYTRV